ncbi:MAG: nucleoside phosphorylase [Propionibacteriaceae bacterium]|jgi:uridine phosphorylase|nr:nucleoside phosphorylase [Propionibacteriaceae bacterium]
MPITDSFDPITPEVISAAQMIKPIEGFPETMIVTFQPYTFSVLLQQFQAKPLASLNLEEDHDTTSLAGQAFSFEYKGSSLGACLSPVGAPTTVATLEKAVAFGVKKFVVFGTCGTLVPNLDTGGVIIPTQAYRDEGTSYHYAEASDFIDISTATKTSEILTEMGIPHTLGKVWTTDAFFRETQANLSKRIEAGCIAVDMEASAIAAFAQFRGVDVHHFIYAADHLGDETWDPRILGTLGSEPRARYLRLAAEISLRLGTS